MKKNQIFIAVAIIAVLLGLGGYKYYMYANPDKFVVPETTTTTNATTETSKSDNSTSDLSVKTPTKAPIKIKNDAPINGTYKGVIEVGASGFNSFVINIDKDKNWEMIDKQFGKSLALEGQLTVEDTKKGIKDYLSNMFDKGVKGSNAHFVISSGALKEPKNKEIVAKIRQAGYVVNEVNADQEGKCGLRASVPKSYRDNSFSVDMGSGNTKINWYENGNMRSIEVPGAKYYQQDITDQNAYNQVVEAVKKVPVSLRKNCFIIGGVPAQLAKKIKVSDDERYTQLSPADDYSAGTDKKLQCGLNIYRAIAETSKTENFIFDWDANFTIGFLMNLN